MRATIKSIARDLNISHMTVSRALNGSPNVSEETRKLIVARARELGYVKSSAANTMRGDRTAIVGLLLPNIINEFYAQFANTLALLCAEHGLDVVIHLTSDDSEKEHQALLRLQGLQAAAVIMVPTSQAGLGDFPIPQSMMIIDLIRTREHPLPSDQLLLDDGPSIEAAVDRLVATGRRNIGFIGADASLSSGRGRFAAFRSALQRNGMEVDRRLVRTGQPSFNMGHDNAVSLLDSAVPPGALVCGGFEISNGALEACLERGMQFPEGMAFVGYGDPPAYKWIAGGITTISLSTDDIAQRAVAMILDSADERSHSTGHSPTALIVRKSA